MDTHRFKKLTQKYLEALRKELTWSTLLVGNSKIQISLTDVYTMLQTTASSASDSPGQNRQHDEDLTTSKQTTSKNRVTSKIQQKASLQYPAPLKTVSLQLAMKEANFLVLLGEPGAGKSTTLRFIGLCFTQQNQTSNPLNLNEDRIPIMLNLRSYVRELSQRGRDLRMEHALVSAVNEHLREEHNTVRKLFQTWQDRGQLLILLDGLDEIEGDLRADVSKEITHFASASKDKKSRLIVSSRLTGYSAFGSPFKEYTIKPFEGLEEARPYLERWLGILKPEWATRSGEVATKLLKEMESQPSLRRIWENPLLLRLTAEFYVRHEVLAKTRKELYQSYVDEVWRIAVRRGEQEEKRYQVLETLELLAWFLHTQGSLDQETAIAFLKDKLETSPAEASLNLLLVINKMGIVKMDGNQPVFSHASFQDYFVARRLAKYWEKHPTDAWNFLRPRLHHPNWLEPLLILAEILKDPTTLIREISNAHSSYEWELHRDLLLAARLACQREDIDQQIVNKVIHKLEFVILRWSLFDGLFYGVIGLLIILPPLYILALALFLTPYIVNVLCSLYLIFLLALFTTRLPQLRSILLFPVRMFIQRGKERFLVSLQSLGELAIDPLLFALNDIFPGVRIAAVTALGKPGNRKAVKQLLYKLKKLSGFRKKSGFGSMIYDILSASSEESATIKALGQIGDKSVIPDLAQVLEEGHYGGMQTEAAMALAEIGGPAIELVIQSLVKDGLGPWFVAGPLRKNPSAVDALITTLANSTLNRSERIAIIQVLSEIRDQRAVDPLLQLLEDLRREIKRNYSISVEVQNAERFMRRLNLISDLSREAEKIIEALGDIGDPRALVSLLQTLEEPFIELVLVPQYVFRALGKIKSSEAVEPILNHLEGLDEDNRVEAILALGEIPDPRALEPLLDQLQHSNREVRRAAIRALGKIGDSRAVIPVLDMLQSNDDGYLTESAIVTLGEIRDPQALGYLIQILYSTNEDRLRGTVLDSLIQIREPAIPPLIEALTYKGESKPSAGTNFIRYFSDSDALIGLWDAESNKSDNVRVAAAMALGEIADPQAVEPLIKALDDKRGMVRIAAAEALGQIRDLRAVNPLCRKLRDGNNAVRATAIQAIDNLAQDISDLDQIRRLARSLWWLLADSVGESAHKTLQTVLSRMTQLEIAQRLDDSIPSSKPSTQLGWRILSIVVITLLLGILAVLAVFEDILKDILKGHFDIVVRTWVNSNPVRALILLIGVGAMIGWIIDWVKRRIENKT